MKMLSLLLLASLALGNLSFGDTVDQAASKLVLGSGLPQPSGPPKSIFSHALTDSQNRIRIKVWDGSITLYPDATHTLTLPLATGTLATSGTTATWVFEGATADAYETTLSVVDPTADQTFYFPDLGVGDADTNVSMFVSTVNAGLNAPGLATSVWAAANAVLFEGTTADAYETTVTVTDPTADRTVTVPNATGTVTLAQASTSTALTADDQAVTPGSNTRLQLTSDNATATNRTFTLSATGAITGQIYVLIGPATNQCEIAATGIQKLSATWSPTTSDTLTLLFDGTNFLELARSNN